eukprot:jgi/Tetstr1/443878/TSEL_031831.t1
MLAAVSAEFQPRPPYMHGLQYPFFDPAGGGRAVWNVATFDCKNPERMAALNGYREHWDADLQRQAWHPAGEIPEADKHRYTITRMLGTGAEGSVYEAVDHSKGKLVAIKKVINVYEKFPRRTPIPEGNGHSQYLRMTASKVWAEVKALKIARNSTDIMKLNRLIMGNDTAYIILDMLETQVPSGGHIRAGDIATRKARATLQQRVFQFIRGIAFLHRANLVHEDLRWHNVMLDRDCNLVLIDLGNVHPAHAVRWNFGKEGLPLKHDGHQFRRDIWLAGATILSWLAGQEANQLVNTETLTVEGIVRFFGFPAQETLSMYSEEVRRAFEAARPLASEAMNFAESFPDVDERLFDLINEMMSLDRRVETAVELLEHPYLRELHEMGPLVDGPGDMSEFFHSAMAMIQGNGHAARRLLRKEAENDT